MKNSIPESGFGRDDWYVSGLGRVYMNQVRKGLKYILIIIGWLLLWEVTSLFVNNKILIVGPVETVIRLAQLMMEKAFWNSIAISLLRIGLGYLLGMAVAVIFAIVAYKCSIIEEILTPFIAFLKAVPVAAFVVLFLIWWKSSMLAVAICFCIVLPQIYISLLQGLKATDKKMIEMARVNVISGFNKILYIYRPAVKTHMESAIRVSVGMAWKSGIAAEVIGLPDRSIGMQLYNSKISLDTAAVLAWTITIIIISVITEKIALALLTRILLVNPLIKRSKKNSVSDISSKDDDAYNGSINGRNVNPIIKIESLCKYYDDSAVIDNMNAIYEPGKEYYLSSPSGSGKTTLLRLIAGLEQPSNGEIEMPELKLSYLFQEDRLCEDYNALLNVFIVCGDREKALCILKKLLPEELIYKPVKTLSGGEKRRVAIARALSIEASVYLMDEPYTGLDGENIMKVKELIKGKSKSSIVIVATHI